MRSRNEIASTARILTKQLYRDFRKREKAIMERLQRYGVDTEMLNLDTKPRLQDYLYGYQSPRSDTQREYQRIFPQPELTSSDNDDSDSDLRDDQSIANQNTTITVAATGLRNHYQDQPVEEDMDVPPQDEEMQTCEESITDADHIKTIEQFFEYAPGHVTTPFQKQYKDYIQTCNTQKREMLKPLTSLFMNKE